MSRAILNEVFKRAKENLEEDGEIMPAAFVGSGQNIAVVGLPFTNDREKELCSLAIKKMVAQLGATFVIFVSETYMIDDTDAAEDFQKNREKYKYVADHPKAIEVLTLIYETETDAVIATAKISKNDLGKPVVGEMKLREGGFGEGRFMGFFDQSPKRTMH